MKFTGDDRLCLTVPLFHCFGMVLALLAIITHGATMVVCENFDPLLVLASVHKERCTALHGVPTMFIAELNHPHVQDVRPQFAADGHHGGLALSHRDHASRPGRDAHVRYHVRYGLTETSPGMTQSRADDPLEVKVGTVGRELPGIEVKVWNPETRQDCAIGQPGEMCCRGYNVMKGYYKLPQATAEVIDADGWLHSGDIGIKDENGNYRITGRIKDIIIRGGENIYPKEIEDFLYQMAQIKDVQVAGVPSEKYGEEVGAFVILKEGQQLTGEEVRDFCRGQIARFKIPKYVFFVDSFPITGSGKIQKFKLREMSLGLLEKYGYTRT